MNFTKYILLMTLFTFYQAAIARNWQFDAMTLNSVNKGFQVKFNSIRTPFNRGLLDNVEFICSTSKQIYPLLNCKKGSVSFKYQQIQHKLIFIGWFNVSNKTWDITLTDITLTNEQ